MNYFDYCRITDDGSYMITKKKIIDLNNENVIRNNFPVTKNSWSLPPRVWNWTFNPSLDKIIVFYDLAAYESKNVNLVYQVLDYKFPEIQG
jgi:hypothetical protein